MHPDHFPYPLSEVDVDHHKFITHVVKEVGECDGVGSTAQSHEYFILFIEDLSDNGSCFGQHSLST